MEDAAQDLGQDAFAASVRRNGKHVILALVGELDLHARDQLATAVAALLDQNLTRIDVHAGELSFIDSAGLHALLLARSKVVEQGVVFRVTESSRALTRLVELSGLSGMLMSDT
jgi:anti-sigma B factor antagonist